MNYLASTFSMAPIAWAIVILTLAGIVAFEIWMFVSVIRNKGISDSTRVLWILGMLLIHPLVAMFYYVSDYKKGLS